MKLTTRQVAKPWGREQLAPPFRNEMGDKVGEIWFEGDGSPLPLMIKYLFTSEKLSIQVHPSDEEARERGLPLGKEECWLVLDAEPDAVLGIGTTETLDGERLREAALNGEIEGLMDWKPVKRGDFFYIPAGTVHAIGPGVSLIEIQQNADITYRLYDYGRPRELHLEDGVAVSRAAPYADPRQDLIDFEVDQLLVDGPKFRLMLTGDPAQPMEGSGPVFVAPLSGKVEAGDCSAEAGDCLALSDHAGVVATERTRCLVARAV